LQKDFNPQVYLNRKIVMIKIPNSTGICTIWDWNNKKSKYQKREQGFKYYSYKKINNKQIAKNFKSLDEAKKWRESVNLVIKQNDTKVCFKEIKERFFEHIKQKVKVSTYDTYLSSSKYLKFFDEIPLADLSSSLIDNWLLDLKTSSVLEIQHKTRLSYRHEVALLSGILKYYGEYIAIEAYVTPMKKRHYDDCIVNKEKYHIAKNKNSQKYLSESQLSSFLNELENQSSDSSDFVYTVLGYFLSFTGCRVGEACALSWSDINFETKSAKISKSVMWPRKKGTELKISNLTKNGEERVIPLMDLLIEKLNMLKGSNSRPFGLIFSFNGIEPLKYRAIQVRFNRAFKEVGIEWRSCHILRHTFATMFMNLTGMEKSLQGILGHKTPKMTNHYAKLTDHIREQGMNEFQEAISSNKILKFSRPAV